MAGSKQGKGKRQVKIVIDILMSIVLLFLMAYQVVGEKWHEWCGAAMLVLFIIHNILNWRWYVSLFRGRYIPLRIMMTLVNFLCLGAMLCVMYSGIVMSRHVFTWLPLEGRMSQARMMHMSASYFGFVFMSLHIGLHWRMAVTAFGKKFAGNRVLPAVLRILTVAVSAYGLYVFVQARLWRYMFLEDMFVFFDYEKSAVLVLFENLSMMVMWAAIAYYMALLLNRLGRSKKKPSVNKTMITVLCLTIGLLSGCGNQTDQNAIQEQEQETEQGGTADSDNDADQNETAGENDSSDPNVEADSAQNESQEDADSDVTEETTLIAYFTWSDNTYVEDPSTVDIDATTSASVLPPGNVGLIASWIQEEISGDLFSIQVEDLYSSDYDECLDRAADEKADNARPALATHVENMEQYDTVYIGYPNWWYSCPMALLTFLEEYDFSGKHIVLFCSHGTGGLANSVETIMDVLPDDCTVEENVLGVYRPEVADSQEAVLEWVQKVRQ